MIKNLFSVLKNNLGNRYLLFIDQALYALFNFGSIFILSKLVSVETFSTYIIVLSMLNFGFLFSTFFHSSPILVLLRKKWEDSKQLYLLTLLSSNFILCIFFSVVLFFVIDNQKNQISFWFVFLIPFFMSMYDILKKYSYSSNTMRLSHAILASSILNITFFVLIFFNIGRLSIENLFTILTLAFALSSIYLFVIIIFKESLIFGINNIQTKVVIDILKSHLRYSKWIIIGGIAFWGYSQGIFIFAKYLNVSDFGISKVRTIQNILGIVNIIIISIENYYIPYFSTFIKNNSIDKVKYLVKDLYIKNYLAVIIFFFCVILCVFVLYDILYSEKFSSGTYLILIFTTIQIVLLSIRPLIFYLKAMEITFPFFYAHIFALFAMLSFGYIAIPLYGYNGMALTFLISNFCFALIVIIFYIKKAYKS